MPSLLRRSILFALAMSLCAVLGYGSAQEKEPAKDAKDTKDDPVLARMKKDIFFLASDECEGRGVGTLGLDLAAQYIAVQFNHAGLKPGGVNGTYFQPFPFCTKAELDGENDMTVITKGNKGRLLKLGEDFSVMGTSARAALTAPVVFVGYGVTARGIEYDDYAGVDVKGKIVVALRRLPRWNDKARPFDGVNKDDLAPLDMKQIRAQLAKAGAVILVNDASETKDPLIPFDQTSRGIITVSIPFVQMKREVLDDILKAGAGKSLAEVEKAIDTDLKPQSVALKDLQITLNVNVKRQETMVKNVIGYLDGAGPLAKETVVVGAHYDHLGYGNTGGSLGGGAAKGKIHHGADDNGSGSTTVMELARRFAAKKKNLEEGRKMVFMTFTAEERGLIGSRHYCRVEPLFPLKSTVAMFNLDMVGRVKPDVENPKLFVLGMDSGKGFEDLVKKHNNGFDVVKDKSVFGASDHFSFYQQKIPVLFLFTGIHPDYHRPTDTSDKINLQGMKKVADFAEKVIDEWRTDPKRPEFIDSKSPFTGGGGPKGPRMGILPDYQFGGKGVLLDDISAKGPAADAGLKKGDVIIEIAGKGIADVNAYMSVMATHKAGVAIEIKILRDSKEMLLKVTPK